MSNYHFAGDGINKKHYKATNHNCTVTNRKMVPTAQFKEADRITGSELLQGDNSDPTQRLLDNNEDNNSSNYNNFPAKVKYKRSRNDDTSDGSDSLSDLSDKVLLIKPNRSSSNINMEDTDNLIPPTTTLNKQESMFTIALQMLFPFIMAGFGMVAAGIVLDKVQHWKVFEKVPEIFILVPALLGLKGNLEMTLASRLSTNANKGLLDTPATLKCIVTGNMFLVEGQAMVVGWLASLVAMVLGWIPDGKWESNHAMLLCLGSLLTGALASFLLGGIMILVIIISRKYGINPDNVATPIAASLGDLVTLLLLSYIVESMYNILYDPSTYWIGPAIIAVFCVLTPLFLYLSYKNKYTKEVVIEGWEPVIAAMGISSIGGFILDFAVSANPGIAVFSPVINGVGGNLVAIQSSRISTQLHQSGVGVGRLPGNAKSNCVTPFFLVCGKENPHASGAKVMLLMVVPAQLLFLMTIQLLQAGHTTISIQFVIVYLIVSLIQVAILLQCCHWLVQFLWQRGSDPDNSAIPYLTALGDLLGTALLGLGFLLLWTVGDRDGDVGD